ncbi:MAG: hypothetical protein ACJ74D_03045, partial [Gaiellaceae bacterium]
RGKMVRMHTIVLYPILTTLIALAPEAIPLIFGPAWEPAVFPTQVLAVAGMASAAVAGSAQLAFAVGKPKAVFYFLLAALLVYVGVLLLASGYGLRAVVISVAVYQVIFVAAQFNYLESRQAGIPRHEIWAAIVPALGASVISLAATYPVARALDDAGLGSVLVILLAGILALAVYAVALRVLYRAAWDEALDLARELIGRKRRKAVDVPVTGE